MRIDKATGLNAELTGSFSGSFTGIGNFTGLVADSVAWNSITSKPADIVSGSDQIASTFAQTILDDADAAAVRTTIGVDGAGTDNSTDVTLTGTPDYISISGQVITRSQIDLTADVTGDLPIAEGGTGASDAGTARTNLGVDAAGTDNSTDVSLTGTPDYISISGQVITRNQVDLTSDVTGTLPVANMAATALTTIQTAANQTAHLALTAEEGDVVVRSDENKTYMHNGGTAGTMADYTLLATPTDAVTSVNGGTGVVTVVEATTANVTTAGALMDTEVTNLADVKAFDTTDYATAAQGTTADSAQQPPSEGAFVNGDKTKLDGIETGAKADQTLADLNLDTTNDVQFDSFGVGTAASGTSGEIRATGDITAYYSSDERLKENFKNLDGALDKVNKIGGYEFDWKEGIEDVVSKKGHDIGVKAQELQAQYPELVHERDNGFLAVDYIKLNAVLIEAVKELTARVVELEKRS